SDEIREAARMDGVSAIQEFRYIVLPHLNRFIQLGALLGSVYIVQEFDTIYMTTQGGPGTASTNLPFLIYQVAFAKKDVGEASALGVIVVIMTIRPGSRRSESKPGIGHRGSLHEQGDGWNLHQPVQGRQIVEVWQAQRRHGQRLLDTQPQQLTAGDQHPDSWSPEQQCLYQRGGLVDVLEVIQDQQRPGGR